MSLFTLFMLWLAACWAVVSWTERPLQPDRLKDGLDVDLSDVHRQRVIREASWWENPQVNLKLTGRWLR